MGLGTIFLVVLMTMCETYIVPINDETHDCISVSCENNGTLQMDTCTCVCQHGYSGFLCEQVLVQSEWPEGSFSLPMSMFGCPEEDNRGWSWGYVNLTLPSSAPAQIWNDDNIETIEPNILGPYYLRSLQLNFCTKQSMQGNTESTKEEWGKGNYCLLKAGFQCPNGFDEGQIGISGYHYTDDDSGGTLPNITMSDTSLKISFCCRDDGNEQDPLKLPTQFLFHLFLGPTNESCQTVEGMLVQKNLFYMTDVNSSWVFTGKYPNVDNITHTQRIGIPFCYYTPYARRECYYEDDAGVSYKGRVNVSESGKPCRTWSASSSYYVNSRNWYGEFEENFCRNYGEYGRTTSYSVCVIDDDLTMERCNVSICDAEDPDIRVMGANKPFYNIPGTGPEYAADGLIVSGQAFRANRPVLKPWYQIDLQEHIEVHAIKTYRFQRWFPVTLRFIGTYVSKHQWDFLNYGAYRCDDIRFPRKATQFRFQCKRPIVGQYVTLRNVDTTDPGDNGYKFYYMSLQEVEIYGKVTTCGRPLGMITGNIYSYQIEESSVQYEGDIYYMNYNGRVLNPGIGWCSSSGDGNPWLMIDLIAPTKVQGLLLQGWNEGQKRKLIRKFTLSYGVNKGNLIPYEDPIGRTKIFHLDEAMAATSIQRFILSNEIMARFVRIYPFRSEDESACLKMEVLGCQKQAARDLFCKPGSTDFGFEEVKRHAWWMEEPLDAPYYNEGVPSKEACRDLCLQNNCTSLFHDISSDICLLHEGHRYNPEHYGWWVKNVPNLSISSHRLCFREFKRVDACGDTIEIKSNESVMITSPGAPLMYEQGLNCSWRVIVDSADKYAKLEIIFVKLGKTANLPEIKELGVFDVNPGSCKDTLTIQTSTDEISVVDHSNEEQYSETVFLSSTPEISINLLTCFQSSSQGQNYFEIKASSEDIPGCNMVGEGCEARCTVPTAYISSDRFPSKYEAGDSCVWTIEGTFGQFIELEIINIDVPDGDSSCSKSFVAVYDTNLKGEERLIDRYCKEQRPYEKILSRWQKMRIEFRASSGLSGRGFLGKYSIRSFTQTKENVTDSDCGSEWDFFQNSCYQLYNFNDSMANTGLTWIQAEEFCSEQGANLVSINSKEEMDFIHFSLTTVWDREDNTEFYIGLKKNMKGTDIDSYQWTDGSPLTFTAWYKNPTTGIAQPDGLTNERCTSISLYSIHEMDDWNDIACAYDRIRSFICEKEESSVILANPVNMRDQLNYTVQHVPIIDNSSLYFHCKNEQLISRMFVCDGENDCIDNSDEERCGTECTSSQFECDNGQCISISLYCDFIPQCHDGSDETFCERPSCSDSEWRCSNGQCISIQQRCDLQKHCFDKSDEDNCGFCDSKSFQCYDQKCIPQSLVCDGYVDCSGRFSEDENQDCQNFVQRSCADWWSLGKRQNGEYMINMGIHEAAASVECRFSYSNGSIEVITVVHHLQEEVMQSKLSRIDENVDYLADDVLIGALKEDSLCTQNIRLVCHSTYFAHNFYWYANDGTMFITSDKTPNCSCPFANKCEIGKESCNCNTTIHTWRRLGNNDELEDHGIITNETLLPIRRIYTGDPQAEGRWMEFTVGPLECTEDLSFTSTGFLCRSGVTVPIEMRCLLDYDKYGEVKGCRDLSHLEECETFKCPRGFVKCRDSYCIGVEMMCDGTKNCAEGEDEINCENSTCPGLFKCKESSMCLDISKVCDGIRDCPNNDDEFTCSMDCPPNCSCDGLSLDCPASLPIDISQIPMSARKVNFRFSDFASNLPLLDGFRELAELNLTFCGIRFLPSYYFHNLSNLYSLDLSHNNLTSLLAGTFDGLRNLNTLILQGNYDLESIEPHAFMGLSKLTHLSIQNTKLSTLKRETFVGLKNVEKIELRRNKIYSIEADAFSTLSTVNSLDIRNNEIEEFSSGIFYGLSKLEALYTDAYVFCCLKPATVSSEKCFPKEDEFSSCTDLMRNDVLRWFLWLIGISALLGNFGVILYRFIFDRPTLKKGHGVLIANLGVSDFFMGVYLIIIASADIHFRGRYIWNDLSWRRGDMCKFAGMMSTIASECSVIFLCLITIDRIIAVRFPFGQYRITQKRALVACGIAWAIIFLLAVVPLLPSSYFMGEFYSRSAVCLALPLTRDKPAGWEYGTAIFIIFNFLIFLIIAFGQMVIYKEISIAIDAKIRTQRKNQDVAIARGLFLVVLTDFVCWFPIGVMDLMALSGWAIPGEVYAWTAVFILPINSALNPFLYTFSTIIKQRGIGGSMRFSMKRVKSVSSTNVSTIDTAWTDVLGNEMFIFGGRKDGLYSLSEHMTDNLLSITEMTSLVKQLTCAIAFLHDRGMVHGKLNEENIILTLKGKEISTISVKATPKLAEEENDVKEDIFHIGQLIRRLLRQHQQKLVLSKSIS